jgi:hypothetical protein
MSKWGFFSRRKEKKLDNLTLNLFLAKIALNGFKAYFNKLLINNAVYNSVINRAYKSL